MRVLACGSSYGGGGVGQHFAQLVEDTRRDGRLARYYAPVVRPGDEKGHPVTFPRRLTRGLLRYTPLRYSPSWITHIGNELLDWRVASRLSEGAGDRFMGFVGKSLRCFRRARKVGFAQCELVAANSHVDNLWRLQEQAHWQHGIKDGWLNRAQRRKTLKEYEQADVIFVHSEYVRETFIDGGVPARKLERMYLRIHPRFQPPASRPDDGVFRVVYTGRVVAAKGIPLLVKAFSKLDGKAELTLVGGWSTRSMKKYMEAAMERDPRIRTAPGDPRPHLQRADVYVHPSYEDGFSYSPMEALACGTPAVVTEDTGMKEYVQEGENGFVVPTGRWEALLERMRYVRQHPMAKTLSDELPVTIPQAIPNEVQATFASLSE